MSTFKESGIVAMTSIFLMLTSLLLVLWWHPASAMAATDGMLGEAGGASLTTATQRVESAVAAQASTVPDLKLYDIDGSAAKTLNGTYANKYRVVIVGRPGCSHTRWTVNKAIELSKKKAYKNVQFIVLDCDGDKDTFKKGFKSLETAKVRFFSSGDSTYNSWAWGRYRELEGGSGSIMLPFLFTIKPSGAAQGWTDSILNLYDDFLMSVIYDAFGIRDASQRPSLYTEWGDTESELKEGEGLALKHLGFGPSGNIAWKSSKNSVAKVDRSGKVTALKPGKARISATGSTGKVAALNVEVYSKGVTTVSVRGTSDAAEAHKLLAKVNSIRKARGCAALKWDKKLEAYALTRAIERSVQNGSTKLDRSTCYDDAVFAAPSIKLPYSDIGGVYDSAELFTAQNLIWDSSITNDSYGKQGVMAAACFIDGGGNRHWSAVFTGGTGSGTYAFSGKKATSVKVNVTSSDLKIALSNASARVLTGKSNAKRFKVYFKGTHTRIVPPSASWKSSNPKTASVDSAGTVTAKKAGTATISVSAYGKTAKCKVTVPQSIAKAKVSGLSARKYTGKAQKPALTVKVGGKTLKKGRDYTVKFSNNVKVGKAKVVITGKGGYSGTLGKSFKIVK